jgi:hypothetical protein
MNTWEREINRMKIFWLLGILMGLFTVILGCYQNSGWMITLVALISIGIIGTIKSK